MERSLEWSKSHATLSDKSATKEFGLSRNEIIDAINDGKLQYRMQDMHGNPWIRLLRSELEEFVKNQKGADYLTRQKLEAELAGINKEIRSCKIKIGKLTKQKTKLEHQMKPSPQQATEYRASKSSQQAAGN